MEPTIFHFSIVNRSHCDCEILVVDDRVIEGHFACQAAATRRLVASEEYPLCLRKSRHSHEFSTILILADTAYHNRWVRIRTKYHSLRPSPCRTNKPDQKHQPFDPEASWAGGIGRKIPKAYLFFFCKFHSWKYNISLSMPFIIANFDKH